VKEDCFSCRFSVVEPGGLIYCGLRRGYVVLPGPGCPFFQPRTFFCCQCGRKVTVREFISYSTFTKYRDQKICPKCLEQEDGQG